MLQQFGPHIEHVEVVVDFDAGTRLVAPLDDRGVAAAGTLDGDWLFLRAVHLLETKEKEQK